MISSRMFKMAARSVLAIIFVVLAGCQMNGDKDEDAQKIVSKAMDSEKKIDEFYGESIVKMSGTDEPYTLNMKEHISGDGSRKTIIYNKADDRKSVALIADGKMTLYEEKEKKALVSKVDGEEAMHTLGPRDQIRDVLENIKKTHQSKLKDEPDLLGRKTDHIQLRPKGKDTRYGDVDVWVDQETGVPLKMKWRAGKGRMETEYKKADFSPEFKANTFKLDLPEDVQVENADEQMKTD